MHQPSIAESPVLSSEASEMRAGARGVVLIKGTSNTCLSQPRPFDIACLLLKGSQSFQFLLRLHALVFGKSSLPR